MRVLGVVPARAGSKRVVGKNTKILGSKPLLAWTIDAALASRCDVTMVSTESEKIASLGIEYGADVPFLRSTSLARDESNVVDALLEVLARYRESGMTFDSIALLQPTSPFRQPETIDAAISLHESTGGDSVVSVSPASVDPRWFRQISDGRLAPYPGLSDESQDGRSAPDAYQLNGSIYVCTVKQLVQGNSLYSPQTRPLVIRSGVEALDIDTPDDWRIAECFANCRDGLAED